MKEFSLLDAFADSREIQESNKLEDAESKLISKKTKELDIITVLKQADKQNYDYYNSLSDQAKKEFSPWMIQRWIGNKKLEMVNELTNPLINALPHSMVWRLFCAIGLPGSRRYMWNVPPKKISGSKSAIVVLLVAKHYNISTRVAKTYLPLLTNDDILEIASLENVEKKQLSDLKRSLKRM